MKFIKYINPSDLKATGVLCDNDGSHCDLAFEICISDVGKRSVELSSECSPLY